MGEEKWRPDKIGALEAGEIRRGRWEGLSGKSRRGAEGDCPTHLGLGSQLSSQANTLPSKPPPGCVGPWGHRREAGEFKRGRINPRRRYNNYNVYAPNIGASQYIR